MDSHVIAIVVVIVVILLVFGITLGILIYRRNKKVLTAFSFILGGCGLNNKKNSSVQKQGQEQGPHGEKNGVNNYNNYRNKRGGRKKNFSALSFLCRSTPSQAPGVHPQPPQSQPQPPIPVPEKDIDYAYAIDITVDKQLQYQKELQDNNNSNNNSNNNTHLSKSWNDFLSEPALAVISGDTDLPRNSHMYLNNNNSKSSSNNTINGEGNKIYHNNSELSLASTQQLNKSMNNSNSNCTNNISHGRSNSVEPYRRSWLSSRVSVARSSWRSSRPSWMSSRPPSFLSSMAPTPTSAAFDVPPMPVPPVPVPSLASQSTNTLATATNHHHGHDNYSYNNNNDLEPPNAPFIRVAGINFPSPPQSPAISARTTSKNIPDTNISLGAAVATVTKSDNDNGDDNSNNNNNTNRLSDLPPPTVPVKDECYASPRPSISSSTMTVTSSTIDHRSNLHKSLPPEPQVESLENSSSS